jgi:pimeloyl-ACP methyl ester carboxylesterase
MERRGRVGSGEQRPDHSIDAECADLTALTRVTRASAVFGHSFGALVVLETLRQQALFDEVYLYEPGVPVRDQLRADWLDDYQRLLEHGDRRGAFASMVKGAGFAPRPLRIMPHWYVDLVLRLAIRGEKWTTMDPLLEANLTEHRIQRDLNAPTVERYSTITADTLLLGGAKSPDFISTRLLNELADVLPHSTVTVLPGQGHLAPIEHAGVISDTVLEHHRAISSTEQDRTRVLRGRTSR